MTQLQRLVAELPEGVFTGGPRDHFEPHGRLQLITLLRCGLYPQSKVLDIGCGCLRGGYWVIHFLDPDCYCGLEPNGEMLKLGLESILPPGLLERKRPRFDQNDRFDPSVFEERFDFFIARSVWTHASPAQLEQMLDAFDRYAKDDALFLTSYKPASVFPSLRDATDQWTGRSHLSDEPGLVKYPLEWIRQQCQKRGMSARELQVDFLRQVWLAITKDWGERPVDEWLASLKQPLWLDRDRPDTYPSPVLRKGMRESLEQKRLIFTVTTGRSGSDFLSSLAKRLPGVTGKHEPGPNFVYAMRNAQREPRVSRRFLVEEKLPRIANDKKPVYLETSHLFCKGFLEPLLELDLVPDLILLTRPARAVASSMFELRTVPARTLRGDRWYLRPDDPGVLVMSGWQSMHDYQLCYWYCLEIARRQRAYAELVRQRGGRVLELSLKELVTQAGLEKLSLFVIGRKPPLRTRYWFWRSGRRPRNAKQETKQERGATLPEDLDALEREVHERTGVPLEAPPH